MKTNWEKKNPYSKKNIIQYYNFKYQHADNNIEKLNNHCNKVFDFNIDELLNPNYDVNNLHKSLAINISDKINKSFIDLNNELITINYRLNLDLLLSYIDIIRQRIFTKHIINLDETDNDIRKIHLLTGKYSIVYKNKDGKEETKECTAFIEPFQKLSIYPDPSLLSKKNRLYYKDSIKIITSFSCFKSTDIIQVKSVSKFSFPNLLKNIKFSIKKAQLPSLFPTHDNNIMEGPAIVNYENFIKEINNIIMLKETNKTKSNYFIYS